MRTKHIPKVGRGGKRPGAGRPRKDYSAIKADWQAGIKPIRQIARDHEVSEKRVRALAKIHEWTTRAGGAGSSVRRLPWSHRLTNREARAIAQAAYELGLIKPGELL